MATDVLITGDGLTALQTVADNPAPLGPGGGVEMEGTSAAGATDDGSNPVKVGGVYTATAPTLTEGQRGNLSFDTRNNVRVLIASPQTPSAPLSSSSADGATGAAAGIGVTQSAYIGGSAYDRIRTPNVFKPQTALSVASEATWWTPASGKKFRLMGGILTGSVAGDYIIRDNTAGSTILVIPALAGAPVSFALGNGILSGTADNVLTVDGPPASTASGTLFGTEE